MATYVIGDIHGCYYELMSLLRKITYSPSEDFLWFTGDLVNRGPHSLEVLRYIKSLGNNIRIVLGNHDINLLAIYEGVKDNKKDNNITSLLKAPDLISLISWLRCQPLLQVDEEKKLIMSHAGITPQWDLNTAKKCASNIEYVLTNRSDLYFPFLKEMYKNTENDWSENLSKLERLQFTFNAFTRMRYCFLGGKLEFHHKKTFEKFNKTIKPWFSIPRLIDQEYSIVFGHWSSLQREKTPDGIYAIDTGCCWGGNLTCLRWEDKSYFSVPFRKNKL